MARTVSVEELLLRHRAIDEDQLREAREQQKKMGGDLGRVLLELGFVSEELLLRAQAHQLGIPLVDPAQSPPPRELAHALGEKLCKRFGVIPVSGNLEAKLLRVATSTPASVDRLTMLSHESGFRIEAAAATSDSIARALRSAFAAANDDFAAPPLVEPEPVAEAHDAAELRERLERLEKMLAHPQFAAMIARVERLEQIAERDHHALNVILQVLIDLGFISRDELKARLQKP